MLLYESHSLIHLRLLPSKGRYFANIFIYFVSVWHSFKHFPDNTFQYDIDEIHKEAFSSQNHVMNTSSILFHRRRKSGGQKVEEKQSKYKVKFASKRIYMFFSLDGSKHMICSNQKLQSSMIKRPIGAIAHCTYSGASPKCGKEQRNTQFEE